MNNKKPLQKISEILNASSETFMLVALVSLFALPFVIGANIEPVVKGSESLANRPARAIVRDMGEITENLAQQNNNSQQTALISLTSIEQKSGQVLGVSTSNNPFIITEDSSNLSYFSYDKTSPRDNVYNLSLSTTQVFGRISILTLKNDSSEDQMYKVMVQNLNEEIGGKFVYLNQNEYEIGSEVTASDIELKSGEEMQISLMSNKSKDTKLGLSIELLSK